MQRKPVFIKLDNYKDILDIMMLIKNNLKEANDTLALIDDLKHQEDAELDLWKNELDDIARKVQYIDKTLFEPDSP